LAWRKLRNMERDSTIEEPTEARLFIDNENELQLHNIAKQILERHVSDIEDFRNGIDGTCCPELSDADRAIVEESTRLIFKRFWLLFDMFGKAFIYHDNGIAEMVFWTRFLWLVGDAQKYTEQSDAEQAVFDSPGFFDLCAGEAERQLEPVYDKWDKNLFSEKSFHDFVTKRWGTTLVKLPEPTKEELEQMEKEDQADREFDERVLKEKCPSCPKPCEWYKEEKKKRSQNVSENQGEKNGKPE
jgi:hypothetical protein